MVSSLKTLNYYNHNALSFYERTIGADLSKSYDKFLSYLSKEAHILDAGCGVGRGSKYFLKHGFKVTAFDASEEMVLMASKETGLPVMTLCFQDMKFQQEFDGIWAQASLLHVPYIETRDVYEKIYCALKDKGAFYGSYKYGKDYMPTPERDFWNMNELTILPYLDGLFEVLALWKEVDTRSTLAPSQDQSWLNFVVRKI